MPPRVSEMSAGLVRRHQIPLLDPPHQVVAMQRFIRVDVEYDAYFGVTSDLANPYGVQASRTIRSEMNVRRKSCVVTVVLPSRCRPAFLAAATMPLFRTL